MKKKFQSPVKAVPWEDALGKPCQSFSFDENFRLEEDEENNTSRDMMMMMVSEIGGTNKHS